jgi:hypothetical protein
MCLTAANSINTAVPSCLCCVYHSLMFVADEVVEANADMILEWIRTLRYWLVYPKFHGLVVLLLSTQLPLVSAVSPACYKHQ